jgi:hypothetical protein
MEPHVSLETRVLAPGHLDPPPGAVARGKVVGTLAGQVSALKPRAFGERAPHVSRRDELSLEEVRRRLDELAERRREVGLTAAEREEYETLSDLEARHLSARRRHDDRA